MTVDKGYIVDLLTLPQGEAEYAFCLDDEYFKSVEKSEILSGSVDVTALFRHTKLGISLSLSLSGDVGLLCDRCLEPYRQSADSQQRYVVALAENDDEDIDIIYVSRRSGKLDLSWLAYEQIVTGLPLVHCHREGECNPLMEELLQSHLGSNERLPEDI